MDWVAIVTLFVSFIDWISGLLRSCYKLQLDYFILHTAAQLSLKLYPPVIELRSLPAQSNSTGHSELNLIKIITDRSLLR